ncbi:MAG: nuclear transport factor 2 family protein [Thiomonas sp.]
MPRRKFPPQTPWTNTPDDVEAAFYDTLASGNVDALMSLWAEDEDVCCIHPGGQRLDGHAAVRDGFAQLLAGGGLQINAEVQHRWHSLSSAVHSVVERMQVEVDGQMRWGFVLATNVFIHTPAGWRLVLHHASPGMPQTPLDIILPGDVLH